MNQAQRHEVLVEKVGEKVSRIISAYWRGEKEFTSPTAMQDAIARAAIAIVAEEMKKPSEEMKNEAGLACGSRDIGHDVLVRAIAASPLVKGG